MIVCSKVVEQNGKYLNFLVNWIEVKHLKKKSINNVQLDVLSHQSTCVASSRTICLHCRSFLSVPLGSLSSPQD